MARPETAECGCGAVFAVAEKGPVPKRCPRCRAGRCARPPHVSSAAQSNRKAPAAPGGSPDAAARRGSVLTCEIDYSDDERAFLAAVEKYKREHNRPFPAFTEVLAVARSLGYRKVAAPGPLPGGG
jgi:hypothetical protein